METGTVEHFKNILYDILTVPTFKKNFYRQICIYFLDSILDFYVAFYFIGSLL